MLNEWEALSPANLGFRGFVGFTSKTYLIVNKSQVGFGSQNRRLTTPIPSRKKSGINRCPSASKAFEEIVRRKASYAVYPHVWGYVEETHKRVKNV